MFIMKLLFGQQYKRLVCSKVVAVIQYLTFTNLAGLSASKSNQMLFRQLFNSLQSLPGCPLTILGDYSWDALVLQCFGG
jgi:hypothetical protein